MWKQPRFFIRSFCNDPTNISRIAVNVIMFFDCRKICRIPESRCLIQVSCISPQIIIISQTLLDTFGRFGSAFPTLITSSSPSNFLTMILLCAHGHTGAQRSLYLPASTGSCPSSSPKGVSNRFFCLINFPLLSTSFPVHLSDEILILLVSFRIRYLLGVCETPNTA